MDDEFALGFVIGLFVGEGNLGGDRRQPRIAIKLHVDDPEPLRIAQRVLGGVIYGPYCHAGRRYFALKLNRYSELVAAAGLFEARMPECKKKRQLVAWRRRWGHVLDHPRASWLPVRVQPAGYSTLLILPSASR